MEADHFLWIFQLQRRHDGIPFVFHRWSRAQPFAMVTSQRRWEGGKVIVECPCLVSMVSHEQ